MDTQEFIKRAREVHGDKYDYSKVKYVNSDTKVCIICPEHGEFWQLPHKHLYGQRCSKCSKKHNYTTEEWIEVAKNAHNEDYDYSKVEYINNHTKVCIICPEHGEFYIRPIDFLNGQGCRACGINKNKLGRKSNTKEFIEKAKQIHGDKYDYSKVEYVNNSTKVCIMCPEHGEFWQTPNSHLNGCGCKFCGVKQRSESRALSLQNFINKANEIHNGIYDYSNTEYINTETKVCIICPEHGEFWQTPHAHLHKQGCPKCCRSIMEECVSIILKDKNI